MRTTFLASMGEALRARRHQRGLSQPALARRLDRGRSRVSELETDLLNNRVHRDRLGLFAEACDALDLVPILVPLDRVQAVRQLLAGVSGQGVAPDPGRTFDDVFVDLTDEPKDPPR